MSSELIDSNNVSTKLFPISNRKPVCVYCFPHKDNSNFQWNIGRLLWAISLQEVSDYCSPQFPIIHSFKQYFHITIPPSACCCIHLHKVGLLDVSLCPCYRQYALYNVSSSVSTLCIPDIFNPLSVPFSFQFYFKYKCVFASIFS